MKSISALLILIAIIVGCNQKSDTDLKKEIDSDKLAKIEDEVTRFFRPIIDSLSENRFNDIYSLLHSELKSKWEKAKFDNDMTKIKMLLGDDWSVDMTGSFKGESNHGPFLQATYKIDKHWDSVYSIQFTAIKELKDYRIAQIIADLPYDLNIKMSDSARSTGYKFIEYLQEEKYSALESLIASKSINNAENTYKQIRRMLVDENNNKIELQYREYQKYANSVWYDTISCYPKSSGSKFIFLEVIMSRFDNEYKVVNIGGRFSQIDS